MPSPDLTFAAALQDQRRLPYGLGFGGVLDEVIRCIPFVVMPDAGETMTSARAGSLTSLAGFRAVGGTPTAGTPALTSFTFNFRRLDSLSQDDVTLAQANVRPNSVTVADLQMREAALTQKLATAIMAGLDNDTTGFLGWEAMGATNRTNVTPGAATAGGVLETLLILDDTCSSDVLGNRASAYVTTALGRRNIERAAQASGFVLDAGTVTGLQNEVPFYRGRPIIVASGLANDVGPPPVAPVYAVDFAYVFMLATTGSPDRFCIARRPVPLGTGGAEGYDVWFHGACIVRHATALVRSTITTALSA